MTAAQKRSLQVPTQCRRSAVVPARPSLASRARCWRSRSYHHSGRSVGYDIHGAMMPASEPGLPYGYRCTCRPTSDYSTTMRLHQRIRSLHDALRLWAAGRERGAVQARATSSRVPWLCCARAMDRGTWMAALPAAAQQSATAGTQCPALRDCATASGRAVPAFSKSLSEAEDMCIDSTSVVTVTLVL